MCVMGHGANQHICPHALILGARSLVTVVSCMISGLALISIRHLHTLPFRPRGCHARDVFSQSPFMAERDTGGGKKRRFISLDLGVDCFFPVCSPTGYSVEMYIGLQVMILLNQ